MAPINPLFLLIPATLVAIIGVSLTGVGGAGLSSYVKVKNQFIDLCTNSYGNSYYSGGCCYPSTQGEDYSVSCTAGLPIGNIVEIAVGGLLLIAGVITAFIFFNKLRRNSKNAQTLARYNRANELNRYPTGGNDWPSQIQPQPPSQSQPPSQPHPYQQTIHPDYTAPFQPQFAAPTRAYRPAVQQQFSRAGPSGDYLGSDYDVHRHFSD